MGKQTKYINAPIELYRCFMDDPQRCLLGVLDFAASQNVDIKSLGLELDYITEAEMLEEPEYSGVTFSISTDQFRDFYNNDKEEFEIKALLCYLALKSIQGNKKVGVTNSGFMLMRMCGYASWYEFNDIPNSELGKLGNVFSSESNMKKSSQRIREDTMRICDTLHCYSRRGMRSFVFTISNDTKEECEQRLKEYADKHYRKGYQQ